jgi:hypothetical protein
MGYRFSRQASLASFSPYFLLYGQDPDLPIISRHESSEVVNLDDSKMWLKVCYQRGELFRNLCQQRLRTLPLLNTGIHCNMQLSRVEVIDHQFVGSMWGTYVYLQQITPTTLDVTAGRTIL